MTAPILTRIRDTRPFMRSTALTVLVAFMMLILEPTAVAAKAAPAKANAPAAGAPKTAAAPSEDQRFSRTLQQIEAKLQQLQEKLNKQQNHAPERIELLQLQHSLKQLDIVERQSFADIEQQLIKHRLPSEILARHQDMVDHYQAEYDALMAELEAINAAGNDADRLSRVQTALEHLKAKPNKKRQQPFDPNQLPNQVPDGKIRAPKETKEELDKLIQAQAAPVQVAALELSAGMLAQTATQTTAPQAADLAATKDIKITDDVKELARRLNNDPIAIYNWVRNNIEYIPTYGSIQGSQLTLANQKGNAFDTASLLIALYRAAGIPAHYVYGTVQIPIDKVMNWVGGVTDPLAALDLLGQGGIPNTGLEQGGAIKYVKMEHVWVEAWVDYLPSRGAKNKVGDSWVGLDPSFKQYEYGNPTLDLTGLTYENQALLESLGNNDTWNQQSQTPEYSVAVNSFFTALEGLVDIKNRDDDVDDLFGREKLIIRNDKVLASGLPYAVIVRANSFSQIPDNLRHKLKYELTDVSGASAPIVYETSLPEIADKDLSVGFKPATDADKQTLVNLLPTSETATIQDLPKTIPGYLIRLSAQVNVNGAPVVSSGSFTMGADVKHEFSLYSPSKGWQTRDAIGAAGEYRAIGLDLQGVDAAELEGVKADLIGILDAVNNDPTAPVSQLGFVEKILQLGIKQYHGTFDKVNEVNSKYSNVVQYRLPSYGYFHTTIDTRYFFGIPRYASFTGVTMDIPWLNSTATAKDHNRNTWIKYNRQSGLVGSYLENAVPEEVFFTGTEKPEGISAAKALDLALAQGQQVYVINSSNSSVLNNVVIDDEARQKITYALYAGKEVTVHAAPISVKGWTGSGYLVIDPETGAGAYIISGGANGGFLGIDAATWLEILSLGIDFIPGVGSVKAIIELITGKDLITGEPINRFMTGISVLAGFVGGAGAVKGLTEASEKIITRGVKSNALGKLGEAAVNIAKGLPDGKALPQKVRTFVINGNVRIADGVKLNSEGKIIEMWEVKHVKDLDGSYLKQLQDYMDYIAQVQRDENRIITFELYIRGPKFEDATHITKSMDELLKKYGIVQKYLDDLM
jgi:transglutaminase-like putative cysteine protease